MKQILLLLLIPYIFLTSCGGKKDSKPVYATNCAYSLAGSNYTGNDICPSSGPSSYPCTITANTPTNISISNLYGVPVTAELNCTNNSLTIPTQTFTGSFTISGTGTYTANTIIINWNGGYAGSPTSCTTTYTRQ